MLDDLLKNRENATKTIVYCRNIASCATLYENFSLHLPQSEILSKRLIAMFHRSTAQLNKAHVLKEFPKNDSVLPIVFDTVAFGMGVGIPDVEQVVHWGAPRGLEQFVQESGRAGRDGRQSLSCVYYSGHEIAKGKSTDEMREFCKSTKCVRELMNSYFILEDDNGPANRSFDLCYCCSSCRSQCKCGNCFVPQCLLDYSVNCTTCIDECDELAVRNLTEKQLSLLKLNLLDFQNCLIEEPGFDLNDFDQLMIDNIVSNSAYLMCPKDIIALGLLKHELADEILLLIAEIENI